MRVKTKKTLGRRTIFYNTQSIGGKIMDRPEWHPVYGWATKEEVEELKNLPRSYEADLRKEQIHGNIRSRKDRKRIKPPKTVYMFGSDTDGKMGRD